jgi:hypothetical protein
MIDELAVVEDASDDNAKFWTRGMQQVDVGVEPITVLPELDEEEEAPWCTYERLCRESKFGCAEKEQLDIVEEGTFEQPNFEDTEPDVEFEEDDEVDFPRSIVASIYTRQGRTSAK